MSDSNGRMQTVANQLRQAFATRNFETFATLLADDVRWGDDPGHPRTCRNRNDVLATFSRLLAEGVDGEVVDTAVGSEGVLVGLDVQWPDAVEHQADRLLFQVYFVTDGRVAEIRGFDDRESAAQAAGVMT